MFRTDDTIVAIATPPGRGGIGIVRLAGPDAHRIAQSLTGRTEPFTPRHATLTRVVGSAPFDEAQGALSLGRRAPFDEAQGALSLGRRAGAKPPGEVIDQTVVTLFA